MEMTLNRIGLPIPKVQIIQLDIEAAKDVGVEEDVVEEEVGVQAWASKGIWVKTVLSIVRADAHIPYK